MRSIVRPEYLLLSAFVVFLVLLAFSGSLPGYPPPDPYPYPIDAVLLTAMVMGAELALFWAILRPRSYRRSWARSLVATTVFLPWGLLSAAGVMHTPGYVSAHAVCALFLAIVASCTLATTLVSTLLRLARKRVA